MDAALMKKLKEELQNIYNTIFKSTKSESGSDHHFGHDMRWFNALPFRAKTNSASADAATESINRASKSYDLWGKKITRPEQAIQLNIIKKYQKNDQSHVKRLSELLNHLYILASQNDFFQGNILSTTDKVSLRINYKFLNNFKNASPKDYEKIKNTIQSIYTILLKSDYFYAEDHHIHTSDQYYNEVLKQFENSTIRLQNFPVNIANFEDFLSNGLCVYRGINNYLESQGGLGGYFPQKAFEHWISSAYLNWQPNDKVLDFASWISPAVYVLNRYRPADFFRHDIMLTTDIEQKTISGFSNAVDAPSNYFDFIMAHCAIDNFEGTADSDLFIEAFRILKPGGKILITPLHMSTKYENLISLNSPGLKIDDGANVVMGENSLRFGRLYDIEALNRRIINIGCGLNFTVIHVTGLPLECYPSTSTNRFMLIGEKPK